MSSKFLVIYGTMALPLIICGGQTSFPWFVHLEHGGDDASLPEVPSAVVLA